ncbi:MAG: polysialyltransferase family glycosyltransferase [Bacteroidota bacterium]
MPQAVSRIFLTTSSLSLMLMQEHAKQQAQKEDNSFLILDRIPMRESVVRAILQTSSLYPHSEQLNMSLAMSTQATFRPSLTKRLTREFKDKPGFKQVYQFLYHRQQKRILQEWKVELQKHMEAWPLHDEIEIYAQPMIKLRSIIAGLFPKAKIIYFEHGLGDYMDARAKLKKDKDFYGLFGEEANNYFPETGFMPLHVNLSDHVASFAQAFPEVREAFEAIPKDLPWVLLATQPLEEFLIPNSFWDDFLARLYQHLPEGQKVRFLIKPHPRQAQDVCDYLLASIHSSGFEAVIWDDPSTQHLSLEILFVWMVNHTMAVASPFSSSVFYLSKLFPKNDISYLYSMRSLSKFNQKTPPGIKQRWKVMGNWVERVFGKDAIDIGLGA